MNNDYIKQFREYVKNKDFEHPLILDKFDPRIMIYIYPIVDPITQEEYDNIFYVTVYYPRKDDSFLADDMIGLNSRQSMTCNEIIYLINVVMR